MKVDRGRHNYKTAFWMVDNEKLRGVELLVTGPENRPATYHLFFIKQGQDNEYKYIYPSGQLGLFYKEVPIVQADFANILAAGQEKVYTELEKILEAICNESERSNT